MNVHQLLSEVESHGATIQVEGDMLALDLPNDFPENLIERLRQRKAEVLEHLRRTGNPCTACLCDQEIEGGKGCHACAGEVCTTCGDCLRAAELWRYAERYAWWWWGV
jgi:hypothetical protein